MGPDSSTDQAGQAQEMRFFSVTFLPYGKDLRVVEGAYEKKKRC